MVAGYGKLIPTEYVNEVIFANCSQFPYDLPLQRHILILTKRFSNHYPTFNTFKHPIMLPTVFLST